MPHAAVFFFEVYDKKVRAWVRQSFRATLPYIDSVEGTALPESRLDVDDSLVVNGVYRAPGATPDKHA